MTIKKIFIGVFLLLSLSWLCGRLLLNSDERALLKAQAISVASTTSERVEMATTTVGSNLVVSTKKKIVTQIPQATSSTRATTEATSTPVATIEGKEQMSVTLVVNGKTFAHQIEKGSSVAELLLVARASGELTYQGKEYSGLGMLITGINGKENNMARNDLYWIYSVNGKKATKGVSQYILSRGDTVSWSYEQNTY